MVGYNATYRTLVCPDYGAREQLGWDFLVCEVNKGWPAVHVTLPLVVYLFLGDLLAAWTLAGVGELLEISAVLLAGSFVLFSTEEVELETLAGSLVGDWLLNGTLGVLLGWALARVLRVPPLLPAWPHPERRRPNAWWRAWAWSLLLLTGFVLSNLAVGWVTPPGCLSPDPAACQHVGLLLATALHLALLFAVYLTVRSPWVWHGYHRRRQALFLLLVAALEVWIHLQNAQPWVPLWLGPTGGFMQVWLAVLVPLLPLGTLAVLPTLPRCCSLVWQGVDGVAGELDVRPAV